MPSLCLRFLLLLAVLLLSRAAHAATTIPCEFREGLVWVKVAVPGQAAPLQFVVDSGAGMSVLDLAATERLRLPLGARQLVQGVDGSATAYRVDTFSGKLAGIPLPAKNIALDLGGVSRACGRRIDGLIGADFFRQHIVQIDFARQQLRLLTRSELSFQPVETLPLIPRGDALCVRIGVAGQKPAWIRVDTGCDAALRWVVTPSAAKKLALASVALAPGQSATYPADVQLGGTTLRRVPAILHHRPLFSGESGLLGTGVLSRFVVTFDVAKKRLLLARS